MKGHGQSRALRFRVLRWLNAPKNGRRKRVSDTLHIRVKSVRKDTL
nr:MULTISPECIES: hypothetical protein [Enterobacteriaceae]